MLLHISLFCHCNFLYIQVPYIIIHCILLQVACGSYNLPISQLSFSSQKEKQSPAFSAGSVSNTSGNSASIGAVVSSKTRIRWTQDLHEKFVECVNRLGGAESK